jgi:hypothetical protein
MQNNRRLLECNFKDMELLNGPLVLNILCHFLFSIRKRKVTMMSCLISELETLAGSGSVGAEADVEGVPGGVAHRRQGAPTQVTILAAALQH